MSLWRLIPIQGGRETRKGGEFVQQKVISLKGTVLGGDLRHPKKRVFKNIFFLFGTSTENRAIPRTSSTWIAALIYCQISEHRRLKGEYTWGAAGMDGGCTGRTGDWDS